MQIDPMQQLLSLRYSAPRRWWTVVVALLSAVAALCLVQLACSDRATTARGDTVPRAPKGDRRIIEVDGIARIDITPDRVDLYITLSKEAKTPREAARAVQHQRKGLLTAMKMLGLPSKRMVISHLTLNPKYAPYRRSIVGYTGSLTLIAKIHEPRRLADYVEAAAVAGAARLHTRFRSSRMQEMKLRVRAMALKAARAKAEQIADVTGVKVGQVRTVRETSHGSWAGNRWGYGVVGNAVAQQTSSAQTLGTVGPTRPDAIPLHLTVSVRYAIR
jgi:uncharacterized protein